ncbi:hypothetical protein RJ639_037401 [Escallonia herrerae]|uniref:FLZ-type domain-containing protein n=1 Tax=Escallonia herrerae TaxID=1293975 RepID=A0AA88WUT0_9ASTE|nr:hypothetical protein RJ639_037401 [Escallonia herrerae]
MLQSTEADINTYSPLRIGKHQSVNLLANNHLRNLKIQSYSLDSGTSRPKFANLTCRMAHSSSGGFSVENGRHSVTLPSQFTVGSPKLSRSLGTKLNPAAVSIGPVTDFVGSLSSREVELSEDYTCVITQGPNPKTTHIFGDCILEGHSNEFAHISEKKEQELPLTLTPAVDCSEDPAPCPSDDFLSFCYSCKKKLGGGDIYMYRGEKAFCSWSCRSKEILIEEAIEKTSNDSYKKSLRTNSCEGHCDGIKGQEVIVTGDIDPVSIVEEFRKQFHTEIVSMGPAQEPEKKMEEPKKEEAKKPEEKKKDTEEEVKSFPPYYHQPSYYHQQPRQYLIRSVEEDPNACVKYLATTIQATAETLGLNNQSSKVYPVSIAIQRQKKNGD